MPTPSPSPMAATASLLDLPGVLQLLVTAVLSSVVIATLITALVNLWINRGNRRLAERKDVREGESEEVGRYRAMADQAGVLAEQARKSAETAVTVIQHSLEATQQLVVNLQATVASQNETIRGMAAAAGVAAADLARMTEDRDRTLRALEQARSLVGEQEARRDELQAEREALRDGTGPITTLDRRSRR